MNIYSKETYKDKRGNDMTNEEAIELLEKEKAYMLSHGGDRQAEALDMAIKALQEEPCEDAVSKQDCINAIENTDCELSPQAWKEITTNIMSLPPVTPVHKKGKWINKSHTSDCGIKFVASECTCCGKKTFFDCDQLVYNYCPNCGSFMREVEE